MSKIFPNNFQQCQADWCVLGRRPSGVLAKLQYGYDAYIMYERILMPVGNTACEEVS